MQLYVSDEITLRTLVPDDAMALFQATEESRLYLREWLPWLDNMRTPEDSRKFIEYTIQMIDERKSMVFGIFSNGRLSGTAGYNQLDWQNSSCQIGYWLSKHSTGRGTMTRSVQVLIDYAFEKLGLNRVEIRCAIGNVKSRSIPERLGFRLEGHVRETEWLYDHYVDHAVYGLLKRDRMFV